MPKKKVGRPKLPKSERRDRHVTVHMTRNTHTRLTEYAEDRELAVSTAAADLLDEGLQWAEDER